MESSEQTHIEDAQSELKNDSLLEKNVDPDSVDASREDTSKVAKNKEVDNIDGNHPPGNEPEQSGSSHNNTEGSEPEEDEPEENGFSRLDLNPKLLENIISLGYTEPTPIQSDIIPLMLAGQDVIGQAQTGTGKTAAFSLPILNALYEGEKRSKHVQNLILTPTRELAIQVAKAVNDYGRERNTSVLAVYGGQSYDRQIGRLRKGVEVVVGTPGRLLDLIRQRKLDLSEVQTLILDEADEMLSMGFIEDIEAILERTPDDRQTALFSATMPQPIRRLADRYMHSPQSVTIKRKQLTGSTIEQRYYLINEADKLAALTRLLEMDDVTSALIFVRTRAETSQVADALTARMYPADALNGELSQRAREHILGRFRRGQCNILVATDVAARGLDIENISHVINYDVSYEPESYVHRIGRTGRAGRDGISITLVTPKEEWRLHRIEGYTKQKMTRGTLPTKEEIQAARDQKLQEQVMVWLRRGRCQHERGMVAELVEQGHDPIEIAAAAMKIARAEDKQRPIAAITPVKEFRNQRNERSSNRRDGRRGGQRDDRRRGRHNDRHNDRRGDRREDRHGGKTNHKNDRQRSQEQGMIRLVLNAGKLDGIRPNDVVGTIASYANIPGNSLGAIIIRENYTMVDVQENYVENILTSKRSYRIRKKPVQIERM